MHRTTRLAPPSRPKVQHRLANLEDELIASSRSQGVCCAARFIVALFHVQVCGDPCHWPWEAAGFGNAFAARLIDNSIALRMHA